MAIWVGVGLMREKQELGVTSRLQVWVTGWVVGPFIKIRNVGGESDFDEHYFTFVLVTYGTSK